MTYAQALMCTSSITIRIDKGRPGYIFFETCSCYCELESFFWDENHFIVTSREKRRSVKLTVISNDEER